MEIFQTMDIPQKNQVILLGKWFVEKYVTETDVLCSAIIDGNKRSKIFNVDELGVIAIDGRPIKTKKEIGKVFLD